MIAQVSTSVDDPDFDFLSTVNYSYLRYWMIIPNDQGQTEKNMCLRVKDQARVQQVLKIMMLVMRFGSKELSAYLGICFLYISIFANLERFIVPREYPRVVF